MTCLRPASACSGALVGTAALAQAASAPQPARTGRGWPRCSVDCASHGEATV